MTTTKQQQDIASWYSLFYQLIAGKLVPNKSWKSRSFRLKFALRTLLFPQTTLNYWQGLLRITNFQYMLKVQGMLPTKPHRPYLCKSFSTAQRAQALLDHYLFIGKLHANCPLRQAMIANHIVPLAALMGKDETIFQLYCRSALFDREGEVSLILHYNHQPIAFLTFSVICWQGVTTLFIGGLQGPQKEANNSVIREATKCSYGLFPKRILFEAICCFAAQLSITQIVAVDEKSHVFSRIRYRLSKSQLFFANYREFWRSVGGNQQACLFYLPLSTKRKPLEQVVSKKRAEYRRRYQFLDDLRNQLRQLSYD